MNWKMFPGSFFLVLSRIFRGSSYEGPEKAFSESKSFSSCIILPGENKVLFLEEKNGVGPRGE